MLMGSPFTYLTGKGLKRTSLGLVRLSPHNMPTHELHTHIKPTIRRRFAKRSIRWGVTPRLYRKWNTTSRGDWGSVVNALSITDPTSHLVRYERLSMPAQPSIWIQCGTIPTQCHWPRRRHTKTSQWACDATSQSLKIAHLGSGSTRMVLNFGT